MHSREVVYQMLLDAIETQSTWRYAYDQAKAAHNKIDTLFAIRNHKALEGVIKTLRWVLQYPRISSPLQ